MGQANYIAIASTQGGIGGCYSANIISVINPNPQYLINRPDILSKIVIHKDKSVKYIGGQVIIFDISQDSKTSAILEQHCGIENYLMMKSHDIIILYVEVDLGLLNQKFTTHPEVHIQVAGKGEYGQKFLAQLDNIKTKRKNLQQISYEEIMLNYQEFSEGTLYNTDQRVQRYKLLENPDLVWYNVELHACATNESKFNTNKSSVLTECIPSDICFNHLVNRKFSNISWRISVL